MNPNKNFPETDYCGYYDCIDFSDITINLPNDVVADIEKFAKEYPLYGMNGVSTILLRQGLADVKEDPCYFQKRYEEIPDWYKKLKHSDKTK